MNKKTIVKLKNSVPSQQWLADELERLTGSPHTRQAVNQWLIKRHVPKAKQKLVAQLTGLDVNLLE